MINIENNLLEVKINLLEKELQNLKEQYILLEIKYEKIINILFKEDNSFKLLIKQKNELCENNLKNKNIECMYKTYISNIKDII